MTTSDMNGGQAMTGGPLIQAQELRKTYRTGEVEAQALAYLEHRYIARIHDAGTAEGLPFIAMEFVAGRNLSARLQEGPIAVALIVDIAIQIADALRQFHSLNSLSIAAAGSRAGAPGWNTGSSRR